jgi:hypothetical protein
LQSRRPVRTLATTERIATIIGALQLRYAVKTTTTRCALSVVAGTEETAVALASSVAIAWVTNNHARGVGSAKQLDAGLGQSLRHDDEQSKAETDLAAIEADHFRIPP